MKSTFPSMLETRSKIFGSLTRSDLLAMGVVTFTLSRLGVGSFKIVFINIALFFVLKFIERRIKRGFFKHLLDTKTRFWVVDFSVLSRGRSS